MLARAYAGVILTVLIWGGNVVLLKVLLEYLPAHAVITGRLGLASVVLMILMLRTTGWPRASRRTWLAIAGVGLLGNSFFQVFFVGGIAASPAGIASIVNGVVPVWVAMLAPLFGARASRRQVLGIAVSLLGLLGLVRVSLAPGTSVTLEGLTLLIGAAFTWAVYTLANRPLTQRVGALPFVALSLTLGSLPYEAAYLLPTLRADAPALVWAGVALSALLANVVAYVAWANGIRVLGAARTSVWQNVAPIVGLLLAYVLLGERLTLPALAAGVVTLAGVMLTNWPERSAPDVNVEKPPA